MRHLVPLLILAFILRLFHFGYPLGDLHSWRQSDTAAVARNLYAYGSVLWLPVCQFEQRHIGSQGRECRIPILNPQIDSFVTIDGKATWMDGRSHANDTRNHFAEFPLYQAITAQMAMIMDVMPWMQSLLLEVSYGMETALVFVDPPPHVDRYEEAALQKSVLRGLPKDQIILAGRLTSILASLVSMVFLYLLVRLYFSDRVAWLASAVFGLLPYSVFWSRTVLPDVTMLMFCLGGLYFLHKGLWCKPGGKHSFARIGYFGLSLLFLSAALLMKVFVLFLWLPIVWLIFERYGVRGLLNWRLAIGAVVMLLPFGLWRWWIHFDQARLAGIPASGWLFNGSGVRLKPAWWYWLFQTRLDHMMFNFSGLALALVSGFHYAEVVKRFGKYKVSPFWLLTLLSCFIYLVVFATGNLQHEYYQLVVVPFVSVFVALGIAYLWSLRTGWVGWLQKVSVLGLVGLMFLFGAHKISDWYGLKLPSYVFAGARADALLPDDAIVIADFGGDTTMLYYANRPGWSVVEFSFEELIDKGATHYISAFRSDGVNELAKKYVVVEETPEYVILDLRVQNDVQSEMI